MIVIVRNLKMMLLVDLLIKTQLIMLVALVKLKLCIKIYGKNCMEINLKILKYLQMDAKVNIKVAITVIIYQNCVMNLICKILLLRGLEHLNLNDV